MDEYLVRVKFFVESRADKESDFEVGSVIADLKGFSHSAQIKMPELDEETKHRLAEKIDYLTVEIFRKI